MSPELGTLVMVFLLGIAVGLLIATILLMHK